MKNFVSFFLTRDGAVALGTLILLGVVSHFNTENSSINFLARVGNLVVFLYILWRAAGKQVISFFASRRDGIAEELKSLKQRKEDAERNLSELEARLAHLEAERTAILEESRRQAEALKEGILARAHEEAASIREQAERAAGSQARTELAGLRAEMADELAKAVETALRTKLTPVQHAALIENSLKKVVLH